MTTATDPVASGDPLLTIDQAAEYLSIPKATLYTWRTRRAGFGPRAVKFGGSLRYRRSDLDRWIEAHLEAPDTTAGSPDADGVNGTDRALREVGSGSGIGQAS